MYGDCNKKLKGEAELRGYLGVNLLITFSAGQLYIYIFLCVGFDLDQDKWRNMSVMANGWGSREKARLALKRVQHASKDDNPLALTTADDSDEEESGDRPLPSSSGSPQIGASKRSMIRLDNSLVHTSLVETHQVSSITDAVTVGRCCIFTSSSTKIDTVSTYSGTHRFYIYPIS